MPVTIPVVSYLLLEFESPHLRFSPEGPLCMFIHTSQASRIADETMVSIGPKTWLKLDTC